MEDVRVSALLAVAAAALVMGAAWVPFFLDVATLCCGFVAGSFMHAKPPRRLTTTPDERQTRKETTTTTTTTQAAAAAKEQAKIRSHSVTSATRPEAEKVQQQQQQQRRVTEKPHPEQQQEEEVLGVKNPALVLNARYAKTLLAREDRDLAWAQEKMRAATEWRESFEGDGAIAPELLRLLRRRKVASSTRRRPPSSRSASSPS